jgi:hypothetical protein
MPKPHNWWGRVPIVSRCVPSLDSSLNVHWVTLREVLNEILSRKFLTPTVGMEHLPMCPQPIYLPSQAACQRYIYECMIHEEISSGIWRIVRWKSADVSEEHVTSIFKGQRISQARNQLEKGVKLEMEATCSSETSADFQRTTRRYIPEDTITLHSHLSESVKSCMIHIHNLKSYSAAISTRANLL